MKILITTDLYTTNTNGVVTSVRNLMEELLEAFLFLNELNIVMSRPRENSSFNNFLK